MFYSYQAASQPPTPAIPGAPSGEGQFRYVLKFKKVKVVVLQHPGRGGAMEPARKLDQSHSWNTRSYAESEPDFASSGREIQEWEIKFGKMIFYVTIATSIWFFYWLNGIQCPCPK